MPCLRTLRELLVAAGFALATAARAQTYGPGDQVLTVGSAAFRQEFSYYNHLEPLDGYLYLEGDPAAAGFVAPFSLPDGAVITQMCMYALDSGNAFTGAAARLQARFLVPGGLSPGVFNIPGSDVDSTNAGYGVWCTSPMSYTVHDAGDIAGDGGFELAQYVVQVSLVVHGGTTALGGFRITWHRQTSPAPGVATFNDVPASHPFFQFVEALAASGITAGCGGGNFCPDAPLTRAQMATFLSKALGLYWPN